MGFSEVFRRKRRKQAGTKKKETIVDSRMPPAIVAEKGGHNPPVERSKGTKPIDVVNVVEVMCRAVP